MMKNSISHILSFISMILIFILVSFILIELNLRYTLLNYNLVKINYYEDAYNNIILNIDQTIQNKEIKKLYKEYINKDIVKRDIKKIIKNKNYNISHYEDFYKVMSNYTDDLKVCENYTKVIDKIYSDNIFSIREYKLLNKLYLDNTNFLMYILFLITIIIILQFIIFIINKNLKYNILSLFSSGILMIIPFIYINITQIFKSFIYTNMYYTNFLLCIINSIKNLLCLFGLFIIVIISVCRFYKKRR